MAKTCKQAGYPLVGECIINALWYTEMVKISVSILTEDMEDIHMWI